MSYWLVGLVHRTASVRNTVHRPPRKITCARFEIDAHRPHRADADAFGPTARPLVRHKFCRLADLLGTCPHAYSEVRRSRRSKLFECIAPTRDGIKRPSEHLCRQPVKNFHRVGSKIGSNLSFILLTFGPCRTADGHSRRDAPRFTNILFVADAP